MVCVYKASGKRNKWAGSSNGVVDGDDCWDFVEDSLDDNLWDIWTSRATNTGSFRQLLHADLDDNGE